MLNLKQAMLVFNSLDRETQGTTGGWNPPKFDVRLDAKTDRDGDRYYTIRVAAGKESGGLEPEDLALVVEIAGIEGITRLEPENSAMVIE